MTGSLRDYDALCEALEAYEGAARHKAYPAIYETLRAAAMRCGLPQGDPVIAWSRRRVQTYLDHRDTLDHAVSHLNNVISALGA